MLLLIHLLGDVCLLVMLPIYSPIGGFNLDDNKLVLSQPVGLYAV